MEQLNVFYYSLIARPVYVHDDSRCGSPFFWKRRRVDLHDFNYEFISEVYAEMLRMAPRPKPIFGQA